MTKISSLIKESVKNELGFEEKPWLIPQKLFNNLKQELLIRNWHTDFDKRGRIKYIHLELIQGGKSLGVHKCKPVLRNDRMYLAFKSPKKLFIDAAYVFGESINELD